MGKSIEEIKFLFKERLKKSKVKPKKGWKLAVQDPKKIGTYKLRCQATRKDGTQCPNSSMGSKLVCKAHGAKATCIKKSVVVQAEKMGMVTKRKSTLLKDELKTIQKLPEEELLDVKRDVELSESIIENLANQMVKVYKSGDKFNGSKIKTKKEAAEITQRMKIKAIRSLQYSVEKNAQIKKLYADIKYSDANVISKDLYKYTITQYNQIILDVVKDINLIKEIAERLKKLSLDIVTKK